jgi:hypothetical protein
LYVIHTSVGEASVCVALLVCRSLVVWSINKPTISCTGASVTSPDS